MDERVWKEPLSGYRRVKRTFIWFLASGVSVANIMLVSNIILSRHCFRRGALGVEVLPIDPLFNNNNYKNKKVDLENVIARP